MSNVDVEPAKSLVKVVLYVLNVIVVTFAILLAANTAISLFFPVKLQELDISGSFTVSKGAGGQWACQKRRLPILWKMEYEQINGGLMRDPFGSNPNRETVANSFAEYAALTADSYNPQDGREFDLQEMPGNWIFEKRRDTLGGMVLDIYRSTASDRPSIALIFRGTEFFDPRDWLSNLSWLVGSFNPFDQYTAARKIAKEEIERIARENSLWSSASDVSIVAAGHSLGGGLARHVSLALPCVSAVTFNRSPVANRHILTYTYNPQLVEISEDLDILSRLYRSFFPLRTADVTTRWQYYRMNTAAGNNGVGNHSMTQMATGMARMVADCRTAAGRKCAIKKTNDNASRIWCKAQRIAKPEPDICPAELRPVN